MPVTIEKINKRIYGLSSIENHNSVQNLSDVRLVNESKNIFFKNNALSMISNWTGLSDDIDTAYNKALEVYEGIINYGTSSALKEATQIMIEGIVKVRDADALKRSLKYKFGRLKHGTVKINSASNDVLKAIKGSLSNLQNSLSTPLGSGGSSSGSVDQETVNECVDMLISEAMDIAECDRIVRQYTKIKRFNIDNIISECIEESGSVYNAVYNIAMCIDTFDSPFKNKYNAALECAWYGLNKAHICASKLDIATAVNDYFIFNKSIYEQELEDIKSIFNISPIFEQSIYDSIGTYSDNDVTIEHKALVDDYGTDGYLQESISSLDKITGLSNLGVNTSDDEIKNFIDEFRKSCINGTHATNMIALKALIDKLSTVYPDKILTELPSILSIIRTIFVLTDEDYNINDLCKYIKDLENKMESIPLDYTQSNVLKNIYSNEIDIIGKKLDPNKDEDSNAKSRIGIYLDCIKASRELISAYINTNFKDEENEKPLDDSDEEDAVTEAASIIMIANLMEQICGEIKEGQEPIEPDITSIITGNIESIPDETIDAITDFSVTIPSIVNKDKLKESFEACVDNIRSNNHNDIEDYIKIDCLNSNISRLNESAAGYSINSTLKGCIAYLMCINEFKLMNSGSTTCLSEGMTIVNTLKIAMNNLKRNAIKLSAKEKSASNSIDAAVNSIAKVFEKEMDANERERIAKGSVLPSASRCIKYALTFAVAWAVQPSIAVIGALGVFYTRKKSTYRERQLALDEIEVEIKMCERYIRMYEDEGDMQKLRQCEMIMRNLQRQYQRIKYKMSVDFKHANYTSVANAPGND